jgi:hypothetical protein
MKVKKRGYKFVIKNFRLYRVLDVMPDKYLNSQFKFTAFLNGDYLRWVGTPLLITGYEGEMQIYDVNYL